MDALPLCGQGVRQVWLALLLSCSRCYSMLWPRNPFVTQHPAFAINDLVRESRLLRVAALRSNLVT